MRICLVAHASSIHTRQWVGYFRDRGHAVSLISLTPGAPVTGVPLTVLGPRLPMRHDKTNWHHLLALPRLRAALRRAAPDIVNAHFVSSNGFLAALACPAACPLAVSAHGSDILVIPEKSRLHRWAARVALRRADLITSAAPHLTERIAALGIAGGAILTLQYGVKTDHFHPPAPGSARARRLRHSREPRLDRAWAQWVPGSAGRAGRLGRGMGCRAAGRGVARGGRGDEPADRSRLRALRAE